MKANEIILGTYVYFNCFDGSKIVVRVTGFNNGIVYGDSKNGSHWCNIKNVEPIPLTPEILEKNGFVEWRDKCYRWKYAEGIYISADFIEEEPWAHISNRCYSATPVCRYVHEFQHAMRLCGIEKEIEL